MILLSSTSDELRITTATGVTVDVHASWADLTVSTGATTADRKNTNITTATTVAVVPSPASGDRRTVKTLHIRNRHATSAETVTVKHYDGTNTAELIQIVLLAGYVLHYDEGAGFEVQDSYGRTLQNFSTNGSGAAVNALNLVVLSSDVVNANATANTMADVTGLSFSVTAGEMYFFRFTIRYSAAAVTTGSRWSINGPTSPTVLSYRSQYPTGTSAQTAYVGLNSYDLPDTAGASTSSTTGNVGVVEGFIKPSATGTVTLRFASKVSASAITAQAGSLLEWVRVI